MFKLTSTPYRLRRIVTKVSKNLSCSDIRASDVLIPNAIKTGKTDSGDATSDMWGASLDTGQPMRGDSVEHTHENGTQNDNHNEEPYITTTLKVALHCEGCKRKVVDALCKLKGVQKIDISMKKQRVIVCGHVDPWTLLKVIKRTGKNVEFWSPRDDAEADLAPSEADKGSQPEHQQRPGHTCTCINANQEERDESIEDCPIEPIAARTDATRQLPGFFNNVKMNSYSSVDAKYIDPKFERLPFMIRKTGTPHVTLVGANSYRDVEVKQLNSSMKFDEEQSRRSNEKLTRRKILDELNYTDGHLPPRPADRRRHLIYSDAYPKFQPTQAPTDRHMLKSKGSHKDSYNVHSRTEALPDTRRQAHDDSDVESEELFAVLKTKKGIKFVPVDSSKKLRSSIKISPDYSDSELRRHSRVTKKHISTVPVEGRISKQAAVPCESCSKNITSRYSADVDWPRQHLSGLPRSLRSDQTAYHGSHSSPDYRSAEQYPSEEQEEEDEVEEDEEEDEKLEARRTRFRERSGYLRL